VTVGQVEASPTAKPQLSEIKLTGDDYDYSDIGGEVTPEMQAAVDKATADITSPTGEKTNSAGDVRDGGSYEERFSKVAVWNNLMDEAEFLFAKWNEFNAA